LPPPISSKPRVAVVSPFLDRRHGTERCTVEQINRLAADYEVYLYSAQVSDVDLKTVRWRRVPQIPGPLLIRYIWFFQANRLARFFDERFRGIHFDLVYSPGINCFDASLITAHIVFAEFRRQVDRDLRFRNNAPRFWPRLLHRRMLYALYIALEGRVYRARRARLIAVSAKVADDLTRFYGRTDALSVNYHGLDPAFGPNARFEFRSRARRELEIADDAFLIVLVGNDWKKKGLPCALQALAQLRNPRIRLAVVGSDVPHPFIENARSLGVEAQVAFLPIRSDVIFYYAAADACVAPSLEDAFALPPAEAMACGLPVIVSRQAGVSEIVRDGVDGLVLEDPRDSQTLAAMIGRLYQDRELRQRLGERAAATAAKYTWDRNASELRAIMEGIIAQKKKADSEREGALAASR
jgi:UDP-glucose:(heptosyl)LPS alpha-1,3-glucosyltransferase